VTIIMTTHYLDEAERLCDRLAVIDTGTVVACDSPASLLASIGDEVLELRAGQTDKATEILYSNGIAPQDILVIGETVTASLRGIPGARLIQLLNEASIEIRSVTTRRPTLDDVYLRLTGGRMTAAD
jgi:ABC-2 type transport system ATP-binding protein